LSSVLRREGVSLRQVGRLYYGLEHSINIDGSTSRDPGVRSGNWPTHDWALVELGQDVELGIAQRVEELLHETKELIITKSGDDVAKTLDGFRGKRMGLFLIDLVSLRWLIHALRYQHVSTTTGPRFLSALMMRMAGLLANERRQLRSRRVRLEKVEGVVTLTRSWNS
jgi:hypothetical protein